MSMQVALVLDHASNPAYLSFDAGQPPEQQRLVGQVAVAVVRLRDLRGLPVGLREARDDGPVRRVGATVVVYILLWGI
jgi:hypothetical protein